MATKKKDSLKAAPASRVAHSDGEALVLGMFENHHALMLAVDPADGTIVYANAAAVAYYGWSKEELLGRKITDICVLSPDPLVAGLPAAPANQSPGVNFRHRRADGSVRDVEVFTGPVQVSGRSLLCSIIHDVTEHRRTGERLDAQNQLLNALVNSPRDLVIFSLDRNYCYTAFNEKHRQEMRKVWRADIEVGTSLLDCMADVRLRELARQSMDRALGGEIFSEVQHQPELNIHYEFLWSPIRRKAGTIDGITVFIRDITARKRAELAVQESEWRFRTLVEGSPESIIVHRRGEIIYVNPAAIKLFGAKSARELVGHPVLDRVHAESHQIVLARIRNIVELGISAPTTVLKYFKLDGTAIDVESTGMSIVYDGEPAIYSMVSDITARKLAEAALRESEERFRSIWEGSVDGMRLCETSGNVISVNGSYCAMFGKSIEEWKGKSLAAAYATGEGEKILQRFIDNVAAGTTDAFFEREITLWHGGKRWFSVSNASLNTSGGANFVLSIFRDITEYRRAETELRERDNRLRVILHTAIDGFWLVDTGGNLLEVNETYCRMSGYSAQELQAMRVPELEAVEDAEETAAHIRQLMANGHDRFESRHRRKDGSIFDVEVNVQYQPIDGGVMVAFVRDITERKRADAAHAKLEAQLRESQKMQAIGTLAGGIAHDFNNILAIILGNTELARQDVSTHPVALQSLDEIRKAGSRARDLVQQILSFSRRQPVRRVPTALRRIVEEAERLLRATLPPRLAFEVHCAPDVPPVLADATQIEQAIINLVTNATQAMHGGPGRIGISLDTVMLDEAWVGAHPALRALHAKHPGRTVRLAVSDNGSGMDAAMLERVFEPFFTTREVDQGTGLGLSVVHGIVQTHEGAIEVISQPGKGSTFTLYLPIAAAQGGVAATDERAATPAPAPGEAGGRNILYLDDDESLVFLVQRLLERRGYRISGYTDQREALAALRADPGAFDLVVTDYNMPGMSGLDVARAVRAIRADLPVVVASGFIDEALQAQASGAGVRELIFKANAVEDLCAAFMRVAQSVGDKSQGG